MTVNERTNRMNFTVSTVTLTDEDFLDLVDIAGYGIGYWVDPPALVDEVALTYAITFTGTVDEPGEPGDPDDVRTTVVINRPAMEAALARFFQNHNRVTDDLGDLDSLDGDCIVQYAIFGKLIYG